MHAEIYQIYSFFILDTGIRNPDKIPDNDIIMGLALLSNAILHYVFHLQNLALLSIPAPAYRYNPSPSSTPTYSPNPSYRPSSNPSSRPSYSSTNNPSSNPKPTGACLPDC
jgi:hypothetical protein